MTRALALLALLPMPRQEATMWHYKVVKSMRGLQGQWFDFPTAATFETETEARKYAQEFAKEQKAGGVRTARYCVRSRRKGPYGGYTVAEYRI